MAELTTSQSFADGDTVTAAKLNNIIANASVGAEIITNRSELTDIDTANDFVLAFDTSASGLRKIKPNNLLVDNAVITSKITDGAVTTAKLSTLSPNPEGTYGGSSSIPTVVINAKGQVTSVSTNSNVPSDNTVTSAKLADASVIEVKIANGAVTQAKLATVFTEGTSTVEGTYGSGSLIPTIVVDAKGRVTNVSTSAVSTDVTVASFSEGTNGGGGFYSYDDSVCFLDSSNHIRVAGVGTYGKLGLGAENLATNSVGYMIAHCPLPSGQTISKIYTGDYELFALASNGDLYSCGDNDYGQLGVGDIVNRSVLTKITGISNVADLSVGHGVGFTHCLAVTTSGALYAWGYNGYGQLGDNTTTSRSSPTLISGGSVSGKTITKVYAFGLFSYVIDSNEDVHSCGSGIYGQLGSGTTADRSQFGQIADRKADGIFGEGANTSYRTGHAFILYLGEVWGTGWNGTGGLGLGDLVQRESFTKLTSLSGVSMLAISNGYANEGPAVAALLSNGQIRTWGRNGSGQLGDNTATNRSSPVTPSNTSGITFTKIMFSGSQNNGCNFYTLDNTGRMRVCGKAGRVFGTGGGVSTDRTTLQTTVQQGVTFSDFTVMGGGINSTVLARTSSGQLWCWGKNNNYQCGVGGGANVSMPQRAQIRY